MYWKDVDILHERMKELNQYAPKPQMEAKERLRVALAAKARKMDQQSIASNRMIKSVQAVAFFLLVAWGASLALPSTDVEEARHSSPEQLSPPSFEPMTVTKIAPENTKESVPVPPAVGVKKEQIAGPEKRVTTKESRIGEKSSKESSAKTTTAPYSKTTSTTLHDQAAAYLKQMVGQDSRSYQFVDSLSDTKQKQFVFARTVNGIPFINDHYIVMLDEANNGKSVLASQIQIRERNEQTFPDPSRTISKVEAESILADVMSLFYSDTQNISYNPDLMGFVDAKDGQLIGVEREYNQLRGKNYKVSGVGTRMIAMNKEEAMRILETNFDFTVEGESLWKVEGDKGTTTYHWKVGKNSSVSLQANDLTGEVTGFEYVNPPTSPSAEAKDATVVTDTAVSFLQKYLDSETTGLQVIKVELHSPTYHIYFKALSGKKRQENHVQGYTVDIDSKTGKVIGFQKDLSSNTSSAQTDEQEMHPEKAARAYLKNHPVELAYIWVKGQETPSLVYVPLEPKAMASYLD
ncbi:hypothetical protein [Brevibacillus sp. AF8]|uniref:hypothetical protein n=1 Tax=Brevibacillus sp. AF8 TaxID=2825881 RepID=UPI001E37B792|nr:hypothetical protein [Brevibacillus sp. AF8]MCE0453161.1 hypothetical protein [Brevibacillus sp. AF8]